MCKPPTLHGFRSCANACSILDRVLCMHFALTFSRGIKPNLFHQIARAELLGPLLQVKEEMPVCSWSMGACQMCGRVHFGAWVLVPLQGAAARCLGVGCQILMAVCFGWCCPQMCFAIWGLCWRTFLRTAWEGSKTAVMLQERVKVGTSIEHSPRSHPPPQRGRT